MPFFIDMTATIQPNTDFQINSLEGEFLLAKNVDWRKCGDGF